LAWESWEGTSIDEHRYSERNEEQAKPHVMYAHAIAPLQV
jgi:hypothetical protein